MNRRSFIQVAGGVAAGLPITAVGASDSRNKEAPYTTVGASANRKKKAPFKILYSNDSTNIITCVSPYHKRVDPLTTEMIQATVDEVAGVDVHMLQPGLGWIPWWKSKIYPAAEHYRWVKEQTGFGADDFGKWVLAGNDLLQVFVDRCRQRGQVPFVSYRLNDGHYQENVGTTNPLAIPAAVMVSRFYAEHPEYRIGTDRMNWDQRVQNWAIPEVREYKFSLIREICENYDIDGFELDFMRHTSYFRLGETTVEQRARIMTEFVGRVRRVLDETARGGRHRWLCARVPSFLVAHDPLGIDLPAMVEAGLEMVDLSSYYFTVQQTDLPIVRKMVPGAAVYLEMTHSAYNGPSVPGAYDSFPFVRTNDQEFYTGADLAYTRGGDGVSLFNFVYYREHGTAGRGPFNEPPFHVLKHLGDRGWLQNQPQWYLLSKSWSNALLLGDRPLPQTFHPGERHIFMLDLVPRVQYQKGLIRLRCLRDASGSTWTLSLNGTKLAPIDYVAKPIENPYNAYLGEPGEYACFSCPPGIARDGHNELAVTMDHGDPLTVEYLDLVFS
jgi:hypothetical protein